jgi:superfamily II DNA or RNA helicase
MNLPSSNFAPGNLVTARGRDWVVQAQSRFDWLRLRPLGGADDDVIALIPELETEAVRSATFSWPDPQRPGNHAAALLLRDALRLKLRAGAGPFRSFGNIAVEPRAYQLVPLLMALRLTTVRLLIADDVGIGKTIEAGLIVRELLDRGEITRLAVLCPPHLVEQWQTELEQRFNLQAIALTASSASRIERDLPHGVSLFDHYPCVVVSLDYIKSERHRNHFLAIAPECIIVDEAHTCAASGTGKQLRFELLQKLVQDEQRHLIMLTATPHSGDETAFYNLLSLLKPEFIELAHRTGSNDPLRKNLARHFVQRRRKDIEEWKDQGFPTRMKSEITYSLSGAWGVFFDEVQAYCRELAESHTGTGARLIWYATLALLRCVASSPAAAMKALQTRLNGSVNSDDCLQDERLHDGQADDMLGSDLEPPGQLQDNSRLQKLISDAERLCGKADDPKLAVLIPHIAGLLKDGFHPVIFCRYIATAHYIAAHLAKQFPKASVIAVTGEMAPEQRKRCIDDLEEAGSPDANDAGSSSQQRILVATDCLSEGINLQHLFTAVLHYDLAWNPTRHEQREGRVDRFGQAAPEVRCTMLYGADNPVDGFVLNVILRKGETIHKALGVLVPMPEDEQRINQALVKAALMKRHDPIQGAFDFGEAEQLLAPLQAKWVDAMEKARANRTVFGQHGLRPEEVLPEWQKQQAALGTPEDVRRFVETACVRLNAPLLGTRYFQLQAKSLPHSLYLRMQDEGLPDLMRIDFAQLHRSHPVVTLLADHVLEEALLGRQPIAARAAATVTRGVEVVTTLYLLRLRHQLSYVRRHQPYQMMAEETVTLVVRGRAQPEWLDNLNSSELLACQPSGNLPPALIAREIDIAIKFLQAHPERLADLAGQRANALLADHRRVREAARDVGQYSVAPCLPVDVMGVYVLLPDDL